MQLGEVKINMLFVLLLILRTVAADSTVDCSTSVQNVTCVCTNISVSCNGRQDDYLDIVELVVNISGKFFHGNVSSVDINIENLTLSPNSSFKDVAVSNLKLSSGLSYLESHFFLEISDYLHVLNLTSNSFDKVPTNALMDLKELLTLDLSHNKIKTLSGNDFEGLYDLSILDLSYNAITVVESEAFTNLSLLKVLHLDHNHLQFPNATVFKGLQSLNHLSVSGNDFDSLSSESFTMLPSLKTLFADKNNLSDLENIQINSPELQELSIQYCSIQGPLKKDSLKGLSGLTTIDFSYNNITEVQHHALSALFQLKYINLSYNNIKTLGKEAFSSLFNLVKLDLRNNDVQIVSESAFYNLTKLRYLNLSNNKLKALVCPYTADLFSLESIHLENNQIKTIASGVFIYSPKLKELMLAGNNLECTCFMFDFSTYLLNRTLYWKEDASTVKCNSPQPLRGTSVTEVDYGSMTCTSKQPCESSISAFDYDDEEIESTVMSSSISEELLLNSTIPFVSTSDSSVTDIFENTTVVDALTRFINVSDNQTSLSVSMNLTIDYVGGVNILSSTSVETTFSEISESATSTVLDSLTEESSTASYMVNFSTVDITNYTDLGSMSKIPVVTTVTDNLTTEVTFSPSALSSFVTETASSTSVPVFDVNDTAVMENFTYTAVTELSSSVGPENFTQVSTDVIVTQTSESTVPESSVNPFSLVTAQHTLIDIKSYSFKNKFLCIDWSVDHTILGDVQTCVINYIREMNKPPTIKRLKCPSSTNGIAHECIRERIAAVINEFCIKISDSSSKTLASVCVHDHDVDTVPETPPTSALTVSSEHHTTGYFIDVTVYNDTESTEISLPTTFQEVSSHVTPSVTPILHEQTPAVSTNQTLQNQKAFNITNLNILKEGNLTTIEWTVNRNEPLDRCALKLALKYNKMNKAENALSCANGSYSINPVENDTMYEICLTSNHTTYGIVSICKDYVAYVNAVMSAVKSSSDYSYVILIGLLILVICFLVFLATRAVLKRRSIADGYNVTKEERKVSLRNGSGYESVNHTSRYSYNASEAI